MIGELGPGEEIDIPLTWHMNLEDDVTDFNGVIGAKVEQYGVRTDEIDPDHPFEGTYIFEYPLMEELASQSDNELTTRFRYLPSDSDENF